MVHHNLRRRHRSDWRFWIVSVLLSVGIWLRFRFLLHIFVAHRNLLKSDLRRRELIWRLGSNLSPSVEVRVLLRWHFLLNVVLVWWRTLRLLTDKSIVYNLDLLGLLIASVSKDHRLVLGQSRLQVFRLVLSFVQSVASSLLFTLLEKGRRLDNVRGLIFFLVLWVILVLGSIGTFRVLVVMRVVWAEIELGCAEALRVLELLSVILILVQHRLLGTTSWLLVWFVVLRVSLFSSSRLSLGSLGVSFSFLSDSVGAW